MQRTIISQQDLAVAAIAAGTPTQDDYLDRLVKMIPGEVVGFFLFCQGVIETAKKNDPDAQRVLLWIVAGIAFVATPLYYRKVAGVWKWLQLVLTTAAFAVWLFAIGGPFRFESWYEPFVGSIVLAVFLLFSGLITPEQTP